MQVIVVGAGAVGSMAAWRLAQAGHEVTVFEQFLLDHDQGSSFGDSRVVRKVYPQGYYTEMMHGAYDLWDELQGNFPDRELFTKIGGLYFGPPDHPEMVSSEQSLIASGVPYERLNVAECARRFPALKLRPHEIGVFEPSMGYARASRCVLAAAELARKHGAVIHESTPVASIASHGNGVRVTTEDGETHDADRLVVCAGPWLGKILAARGIDLPLRVIRKTYVHLLPARNVESFEADKLPIWIDAEYWSYGFPRIGDVPGIKIAIHSGGEVTTPEAVERTLRDEDREALLECARERFPDLSDEIVYEKVCLYTKTPDEDFIIDRVPELPGAFLIGGTSGHGFKFAPLLGEIARKLVEGDAMPYELERFALGRMV